MELLHEYSVEITETLQRTVKVAAASKEDAVLNVQAAYDAGEIILDAGDHVGTEIAPVEPERPVKSRRVDDLER